MLFSVDSLYVWLLFILYSLACSFLIFPYLCLIITAHHLLEDINEYELLHAFNMQKFGGFRHCEESYCLFNVISLTKNSFQRNIKRHLSLFQILSMEKNRYNWKNTFFVLVGFFLKMIKAIFPCSSIKVELVKVPINIHLRLLLSIKYLILRCQSQATIEQQT